MDSSVMDDSVDNFDDSDAFSPVATSVSVYTSILTHLRAYGVSFLESLANRTQKVKAKPAPKKATTSKAPPKKLVQTTLKTKTVPKKRPKPDSDDESSLGDGDSRQNGSDLSNTPPSTKKQKKGPALKKQGTKPIQVVENESMAIGKPSGSKAKAQTATELYQKLTQLEHIIKRPDTYIGSVERTDEQMWVYNSETEQMESRKVSFVPGLYKIFDEILVNAADNKQNDPSMKFIKVTIDREKGEISIENDGRGIPIEIHEVGHPHIMESIWFD
jgi:DNA topoisomerase II